MSDHAFEAQADNPDLCKFCRLGELDHILTTNRLDPRLGRGSDEERTGMNQAYLVLPEEERKRKFKRPVFRKYIHATELGGCGAVTTMGLALCETYAADPHYYGATYCANCGIHRPVGANGEFYWVFSGEVSLKDFPEITNDWKDVQGLPTDVTDIKVGT